MLTGGKLVSATTWFHLLSSSSGTILGSSAKEKLLWSRLFTHPTILSCHLSFNSMFGCQILNRAAELTWRRKLEEAPTSFQIRALLLHTSFSQLVLELLFGKKIIAVERLRRLAVTSWISCRALQDHIYHPGQATCLHHGYASPRMGSRVWKKKVVLSPLRYSFAFPFHKAWTVL